MYYNLYIYVNNSPFYFLKKHYLIHKIKHLKGIHQAFFVKPDYDYIVTQHIAKNSEAAKEISKIFATSKRGISYDELEKLKDKILRIDNSIANVKSSELEI